MNYGIKIKTIEKDTHIEFIPPLLTKHSKYNKYNTLTSISPPKPTTDPKILTFSLGTSYINDSVIQIIDLTSQEVLYYIINTDGNIPNVNDPNWSTNKPTEVII